VPFVAFIFPFATYILRVTSITGAGTFRRFVPVPLKKVESFRGPKEVSFAKSAEGAEEIWTLPRLCASWWQQASRLRSVSGWALPALEPQPGRLLPQQKM